MDTETFSLASQQISATQRRSNIIRTTHWKSTQISRFFCCSRWLSVWRLRKEHHERSDQCGLVDGESDEHLVVNEIGHVVRARTVRRCVENEDSVPTLSSLLQTLSYLKPHGNGVEVQERWTPTEGCKACESAYGNKHLVRCEASRYEYRQNTDEIHL